MDAFERSSGYRTPRVFRYFPTAEAVELLVTESCENEFVLHVYLSRCRLAANLPLWLKTKIAMRNDISQQGSKHFQARVPARHLQLFLSPKNPSYNSKKITLLQIMDIVTKLFSLNLDVEPNINTLKNLSQTLNSAGS